MRARREARRAAASASAIAIETPPTRRRTGLVKTWLLIRLEVGGRIPWRWNYARVPACSDLAGHCGRTPRPPPTGRALCGPCRSRIAQPRSADLTRLFDSEVPRQAAWATEAQDLCRIEGSAGGATAQSHAGALLEQRDRKQLSVDRAVPCRARRDRSARPRSTVRRAPRARPRARPRRELLAAAIDPERLEVAAVEQRAQVAVARTRWPPSCVPSADRSTSRSMPARRASSSASPTATACPNQSRLTSSLVV